MKSLEEFINEARLENFNLDGNFVDSMPKKSSIELKLRDSETVSYYKTGLDWICDQTHDEADVRKIVDQIASYLTLMLKGREAQITISTGRF